MSLTHLPAQCPRCRSLLRVRRELLGQQVCCKYCGRVFEVGGQERAPRAKEPATEPEPAARPVWLLRNARPTPVAPRVDSPGDRIETRPAEPAIDPSRAPTPPGAPGAGTAEPQPAAAADPGPSTAELEALRAERDQARAEADVLAARLSVARGEVDRLREALERARDQAQAAEAARRLPVLVRDLQRWVAEALESVRPTVVAVPVGPPPLPPSLDDLAAVERHAELLRALLHTPLVAGKPFHSLFDSDRFQALQARLRESSLLADRLINNVERSKNQKEMMWHLMVAQRTDELQRKRR